MIALKSQYEILDAELNPSVFFNFCLPPPWFHRISWCCPFKKRTAKENLNVEYVKKFLKIIWQFQAGCPFNRFQSVAESGVHKAPLTQPRTFCRYYIYIAHTKYRTADVSNAKQDVPVHGSCTYIVKMKLRCSLKLNTHPKYCWYRHVWYVSVNNRAHKPMQYSHR